MLTYFLQVNVCWGLFYGAYFALLSRETFFRLNRIWLIISLLGGLLLPLIAPLFEVVQPMDTAAIMLEPFVISATELRQNLQNTEGSFLRILMAIYGLGVSVSLGKLLIGFWKIKRLIQRAERFPMDDFMLLQVQEAIAPFSFFRWVFINLNLIQPADLQQIILHEQAHVRERHSFDVVFAEVLGVVFWWSPLVYFYTKSLKNVHEYAADAAVLRTSTPPQYGRLLLRQQQSGMSLSLANPFFSQLKKRILMMTRHPSRRRALVKYALAVPIFLILTMLLASPKTKVMATTETLSDNVVSTIGQFKIPVDTIFKPLADLKLVDENQIQQMNIDSKESWNTRITVTFKDGRVEYYKGFKSDMEKVFKKENLDAVKLEAEKRAKNAKNAANPSENVIETTNLEEAHARKLEAEKQAALVSDGPIFTVVDEQPSFKPSQDSLFRFLGQNIKYPEIARRNKAEGTVYVGFIVEIDGSISSVSIKREPPVIIRDTVTVIELNGLKGNKIVERKDFSLGREAVRVISAMPKWKPAKNNGVPVRVAYTLPIKFKLD